MTLLRSGYPSSSLVPRVAGVLAQFDEEPDPLEDERPVVPAVDRESRDPEPESTGGAPDAVTIRSITRTSLDEVVRISIEMDRELTFRQEQLQNPRRLFFDLKGARPSAELLDATLKFDEDVAREIRLGRHPNNTTRVVIDTEGVQSHSVFFDGFDVTSALAASGLGLVSMQERLRLVNGEVFIDSKPGSGTVVRAVAPSRSDASVRKRRQSSSALTRS